MTHYEILELSQSATDVDIRRSYRRLVMHWHPDRNPDGQDRFVEIQKAYEILSDPFKRMQYDITLKYNQQPQHQKHRKRASRTEDNTISIRSVMINSGGIFGKQEKYLRQEDVIDAIRKAGRVWERDVRSHKELLGLLADVLEKS